MKTVEVGITKRILLINSEPTIREVVQACLSHLGGWEVIEASSPFAGLQQAVQDQPDAIVLDLAASGMGYGTFLQRLREQPTTQMIPVVVLATRAKWLNFKHLPFQVAGVIDYSIDPAKLPHQVAKLLNWSEETIVNRQDDYCLSGIEAATLS